MNIKKFIIPIALIIGIGLVIGLTTVSANENGDWKTITLDSVKFSIPPQYQGGNPVNENSTTYMLDTVFDFAIQSLNTTSSLEHIYGYESTVDDIVSIKEKTIGNHDVIVITSNRTICNHYVTYAFFVIGNKIFSTSFNGREITPDISKMIENTPKQEISKKQFYKTLDQAQSNYLETQREYDEAYTYSEGYNRGVRESKHNRGSFVDYYIAYRLTRHLLR